MIDEESAEIALKIVSVAQWRKRSLRAVARNTVGRFRERSRFDYFCACRKQHVGKAKVGMEYTG